VGFAQEFSSYETIANYIRCGNFGYYAVSLSRENGLFLETDNDLKCHNICCSIMPGVLDDGSG
jgi:hypothetical protein